MKIKTISMPYEEVMALPRPKHRNPRKPLALLKWVIRVASIPALLKTKFTFEQERMELVGDKPCLILMNHSCFLDMKLAYRMFFPRPLCFVGSLDGFIGKDWLMRLVGIIPTRKFVSDLTLVRDMRYALKELKASVLMFPEACYSMDGRASRLPRHLGVILKRMDVPLVTVTTYGAFARDPLYNGLQLRKVTVKAKVKCLLTPEEIKEKTLDELDQLLDEAFTFDQFAYQRDSGLKVTEPFRADGLHRVLYQCPHCHTHGRTEGKGTRLTCHHCGKVYEMDELGQMHALSGETEFSHIPDWFDWQRAQVRQEVENGTYCLDVPVDIAMVVDTKALYKVGEGRLVHDGQGVTLDGCDGKLHYQQSPLSCHSLNVDYFWYEIGDVIAIGDTNAMYYCFPKAKNVVTRARLAAEEMYQIIKG